MGSKPTFSFDVQPPAVTPPLVQPPPVTPPKYGVQVDDQTSTAPNHSYAYQAGVLTITDGTPPPPDGIAIGDTVKTTANPTNVRSSPAGPLLQAVPLGTQGKVLAGPQTGNGFAWWQVQFPTVTGWVGFDSLAVVNPNPPIVVVGAAFPGAQGSGAAAVGARSSTAKVYEVTSLADSGSGTLREACEASGPRYAVFRMSGLITPKKRMQVSSPFLTIAGHTCPGGGIVLGGPNQSGEALFISAHDVIARYLTFDGSNPNLIPGPDNGSVGFELASGLIQNVIFDHLSARWWSNKGLVTYANGQPLTDFTLQFSMMYEPDVGHPVGPMTDASMLAEKSIDQDFHHNLFVNMGHRIPLYNTKQGRWASNIVYNYDYFALLAQGGVWMDILGNKYVFGNLNKGNSNPHPFGFTAIQSTDDTTQKMPGPGSFYLKGNYCPAYQTNPNGDQSVMCAQLDGEGTPEVGPPPASWYRATPLPSPKYAIISEDLSVDINSLDKIVLPTVGNSQRLAADGSLVSNRDSQDARVIAQYQALGPGGYYKGAGYLGPITGPPIPAGTPYPSSQHDGISDVWKQNHDLDTSDPTLYLKISPNAGISYIECFLGGVTP